MHTRQSGAAHVPIMFFILLLVMFLGAVGVAYIVTDANTNLRADNQQLREDLANAKGRTVLLEHYAEDIGKVLQVPGNYTGRSNVSEELYANQTLDGINGVMNPEELRRKMNDFGTSLQLASTNGMDDLFSAVVNKMGEKDRRIADAEAARDTAMTQKSAVDAQFSSATAEHTRQSGEWRQNLEQARADYNAGIAGRDSQISQLQQNVRDRDDALLAEQEARTAERKQLQNEIGKLTMQNTALVNKDKLRQPADMPDGTVLVARSGLRNAFIDLGRKDMLQPDTVFRIRARNSDDVKAYARVIRVEQDKAEVLLSQVVDPLENPVRAGDLLYNDLYSPGPYNKRTVYLMGRFSYPYNKDMLRTLLVDLGNTVVDKMQPGVDTVILGDNIPNEDSDGLIDLRETDEYKEAVELGVEFAPLRKIRDLITLNTTE